MTTLRQKLTLRKARLRGALRWGFILAGGFLVAGTLIPFVRLDAWWVRGFDFPRTQFGLALLFTVGLFALLIRKKTLFDWTFLALLLGALLIQSWFIFPYTPLATTQLKEAEPIHRRSIKLLVANVLQDNRSSASLLHIIEDASPDVFLALETDQRWLNELSQLKSAYPHTVLVPLDNTYGIAMYSRFRLIERNVKYQVQDDVPSIHTLIELRDGTLIRFFGLHPRPPSPTEHERSTERDAELLITGFLAKKETSPVIVAGDLNDVAWSPTTREFQAVSSLLDPRIGRGLFSTFSANNIVMRWPLDHVFASKEFVLVSMARLQKFGSDHFPVFIELSLGESKAEQNDSPPSADREDIEDAVETIQESERDGDTDD